jgi:hypothetical protein
LTENLKQLPMVQKAFMLPDRKEVLVKVTAE